MDWQPAETAPKDGTPILLYCPIEDVVVSSLWIAKLGAERGGAWYGTDPMHRLNWVQSPSHWMLMPPRP